MIEIPAGSRVRHARLGSGTVLRGRYRGYEYWVEFKAVRTWVKGSEVRLESASQSRPAAATTELPVRARPIAFGRPPEPEPVTFADRCVLEAFRLGIVPDRHVDRWTYGRDDELAHLRHWLEDQADGSLLIEGAYGTGKSHLLMSLAARAREQGYAVSTSHLDAGEESAAFPKRLYRQIARGLEAPGIGGLEHVLMASVEAFGGNPVPDHPILGPLLDRVARGLAHESDWDAALGEGSASAATGYLPDYTTTSNVYCNLLSGLGWLVTRVLGMKGLLVLVDEVETASASLYQFHWRRAQSFFRGLTMTANDDPDLLEDPPKKGKTAYEGENTGLIYAGHRRVPYLYRVPCGLKVVLATTPGPIRGLYAKWRGEQTVLSLEPVPPRALRQLAERMAEVYGAVHGVRINTSEVAGVTARLMERFGTVATRLFIKAFVEVLDFRRFHPGQTLEALRR